MKIIAGISNAHNPEEIKKYVKAGVGEFFVGYVPKEWSDEYGWELSNNRRETANYQYRTREDLANVVDLIHQNNCKVYLTVNAHEYNTRQTKLLIKILNSIRNIEFDAFIVSNVGILLELQKNGFEIDMNISIGGGSNNIETLKFFLDNFRNIGRFILPRKLTVGEIEIIAKYALENKVRLEIFGMDPYCVFNDEYCFTWHGPAKRSFCQSAMFEFRSAKPLLFDSKWKNSVFNEPISSFYRKQTEVINEINMSREAYYSKRNTPNLGKNEINKLYFLARLKKCGLCAFQKFKEWGIEAVKLPLRGQDFIGNIAVIELSKKVIDEENAIPEYCKSIMQSPRFCSGISCYYDYPYPK